MKFILPMEWCKPRLYNVATCGAIKGAVSALDLKDLKCQVQLCNTYICIYGPEIGLVKQLGGLHKFTNWQGPVLTDSGGFQVFSLAKLRNIKEEGVTFASHIDGRKIFMGPEESMRIQSIWALPLQWLLMSVLKIRLRMSM